MLKISFTKYWLYRLNIGLHWLYRLNIGLIRLLPCDFNQYLTITNQYILETNIINKIG